MLQICKAVTAVATTADIPCPGVVSCVASELEHVWVGQQDNAHQSAVGAAVWAAPHVQRRSNFGPVQQQQRLQRWKGLARRQQVPQ